MFPAVAVTLLSVMYACEEERMTLVAIVPSTARDLPLPKALPPEELAELSAVAVMMAFCVAVTSMSPPRGGHRGVVDVRG